MTLLPKAVFGWVTSLLLLTSATPAFSTEEHALFKNLLDGYNINVRPTRRAVDTVNVSIDMALMQILDFNMAKQQLGVVIWMRQYWDDAYIRWNTSEYGGVKEINISPDLVWTPDITLYNDASTTQFVRVYMSGFNVRATSKGAMQWLAPVVTKTICILDMSYFPWDVQHCHLQYGSWTFDSSSLDFFNRTCEVGLGYYTEHSEWELVRTNVRRHVDKYPCCENAFPSVYFEFTLKRKYLYYIINLLVPSICITLMALLSFCLPPDSGEKISLAVTILLATTVFLLLIGESIPVQSTTVPHIAKFFTAVLIILSVSTCMSVHVLCIHHNGGQGQKVPRWVKTVCFRVIGPALGLSRRTRQFVERSAGKVIPTDNKVATPKVTMRTEELSTRDPADRPCVVPTESELSTLNKIHHAVDSINEFFQGQLNDESTKSEWILLAVILDRLYFVLTLITIMLVCVFLILYRPFETYK